MTKDRYIGQRFTAGRLHLWCNDNGGTFKTSNQGQVTELTCDVGDTSITYRNSPNGEFVSVDDSCTGTDMNVSSRINNATFQRDSLIINDSETRVRVDPKDKHQKTIDDLIVEDTSRTSKLNPTLP